jgi:cysteine desulfuration protein SufE
MSTRARQEELIEDYLLIDNDRERFQLIVETAGASAKPYPEDFRTDSHLVPGCVSKMWLATRPTPEGAVELLIESESPALHSIGALFSRIYTDGSPQEILDTEPEFVERLGIDRHLTPTRLRGLRNLRRTLINSVTALFLSVPEE